MMILKVKTKKDLKKFIYYVKDLYKNDTHYVYPIFFILTKELRKEVLQDNTYTAILSLNENKEIQGRLLYTMEHNTKENLDICYWSYFDCIDSPRVTKELFEYMENDMKNKGLSVSEGSFTPYDPDNRRGILINNFDNDPVIFTSYNKKYIPELLGDYGFKKIRDTFSVVPKITDENMARLAKYADFFERRHNITVDMIDFHNIDQEINDIHQVLLEADTDIIYQETPSIELIREVACNLKIFLDKRIIRIAREKDTKRPVGFAFCLLDFNQVFKKLQGKLRPIKMLIYKKQITKIRGMMQYVIPKYQSTGLSAYIYKKIFDEFPGLGLTEFEAGTMMEGNQKAITSFAKIGGEISSIFRIYRKEI